MRRRGLFCVKTTSRGRSLRPSASVAMPSHPVPFTMSGVPTTNPRVIDVAGQGRMSGDSGGALCPLPRDRGWRQGSSPLAASEGGVRPLPRKGLLRRVGLKRGTGGLLRRAYNPSARSSLRPVSRKRQRENRVRARALEEAWGPRPWHCVFKGYVRRYEARTGEAYEPPRCFGEVNAHELVKRSRGGSITDPSNCVPLCNFHNDWVEDHPWAAQKLGLVK